MSDMPPDEFRRAGHEVIDWITGYLRDIRDLPVLPRVEPGEFTRALPASAPDAGETIDAILHDFVKHVPLANTHWNHPRFHAYFSVSASGPGILAEALTAALNVNHMVWKSSPAGTELELLTLGWVRQWLKLPESFFGMILDTASTSTMHALIAARDFVDPECRTRGSRGDLVVYTSEQAHSSVEKGAIAIGLGQNNVRKIAVDAEFRMRPDALRAAMQADVAGGRKPCCAVPTIGTTSTTSIDPVAECVAIANEFNAWTHIDGAYGGCAAILPELRHILNGVENAHSLVLNPHKWFFTPIDCSLLYTNRPDVLREAFSLVPEYLRTAQDTTAVNLMDYGVPLGRRFRSLKLWFVMRYFGYEGICRIIRNHIQWAQQLAAVIARHPSFELPAPHPLSLVCFRFKGTDDQNRELLDRVNAGGVAFLSHTMLDGRFVLRLAIGNIRTTQDDLQRVWECIQAEAGDL
ncbi:MAG TPA: pyridoxal-dependent decarboxylase [Bryobacteraceae bacterium]|nr:pyridoxal-dependent decarboxylase [Bryobacteraceae bacterium]